MKKDNVVDLAIVHNRAQTLAMFFDEMTEQAHFSARKYGVQNMRELVALARAQLDAIEDTIPPAGVETNEPNTMTPDKQKRLEAAVAVAVLAFRCIYGY